jgi:hypothetical protein
MKFVGDFALLRCLSTAVSVTCFFIELAAVSGTLLPLFAT